MSEWEWGRGVTQASEGWLARPAVAWSCIVVATVLGAAVRLVGLGSPSLWVDEFFTVARAGSDPLHWTYLLGYLPTRFTLWLAGAELSQIGLANIAEWQALGVSERAARLGPCWVGIASIPLLGALARVAFGPAVAGCSALLLALLPFHIYWSQMARYYTLEFLFANAFLLCFVRAMQTGRGAWFAAAAAAGVLAFSSHFSALFVVGGALGLCGLAWLARAPVPHLARGLAWLGATTAVCLVALILKEIDSAPEATLADFSEQDWSPSARVLVLGGLLRFEPVVCVVGAGAAWLALRRRDAAWLLVAGIAVGVPVGVLCLKLFFPVAPRYVFAAAFAWLLLAAAWCAETDRRLAAHGGALLGLTGALAVAVSVGFNTYLYARDGAGARARWREACNYVAQHGAPDAPVYAGPGRFQIAYYLEREPRVFSRKTPPESLEPGSWVLLRSKGAAPPPLAPPLLPQARYEIPSKPWSWVVHVLRAPGARPEGVFPRGT